MSDSVTNVQIEDVLSSIRKLVSEEVRAQTREVRAMHVPGLRSRSANGDSEDRLLLTPALRVAPGSDGAETQSAPDPDEAPFMHAETLTQDADLLDLMDRVRAAGAGQSGAEARRPAGIAPVRSVEDEPAEPVTSEQAIRSALYALGKDDTDFPEDLTREELAAEDGVEDLAQDDRDTEAAVTDLTRDDDLDLDALDALAASGRDDQIDDTAEISETVPKFLHRKGISSLGQRIVDVEAVVSTSGGEWEPEADEDAEAAPGPQMGTVPWDEAEEAVADQAADTDDADWSVAIDPAERDFQDLSAVAASDPANDDFDLHADQPSAQAEQAEDVVELPVGAAAEDLGGSYIEDDTAEWQGDFEDNDLAGAAEAQDEAPQDPVQTSDEAFEDEAEDDADIAAAAPLPGRDRIVHRSTSYELYDEDDRATLAAEDETLIDEEVLRDLVAEIVRQELQGALGERITRNVRKLVRREIHRALAAHNLG